MAVELTVIVKGKDGKTIEGASVKVTPGDATGETNSKGEVTLKIDGADRYDITVSDEDTTQTVPYYTVKGRETARLEVNLEYLTQKKKQQQTVAVSSKKQDETPVLDWTVVGVAVVGALLLLVVISLIRKRNRSKNMDMDNDTDMDMDIDIDIDKKEGEGEGAAENTVKSTRKKSKKKKKS